MRYVREPNATTAAWKGNNTYQIVLKGASGVVMDGAGIAMG